MVKWIREWGVIASGLLLVLAVLMLCAPHLSLAP